MEGRVPLEPVLFFGDAEIMTTMKPEDRFAAIHTQLLDLEQHRRRARAHEPKHSDPEHDCMECEILGTLDVLRRSQEGRKT